MPAVFGLAYSVLNSQYHFNEVILFEKVVYPLSVISFK